MSPEQARAEALDSRTDLFSFGVVLYEMATGRVTFPGNTTAVIFDGILNRDPTPASALNAHVAPELDRIIAKALEKDRALRYQTAADLRADLQRMRRDSSSRRASVGAAPERRGERRRRRAARIRRWRCRRRATAWRPSIRPSALTAAVPAGRGDRAASPPAPGSAVAASAAAGAPASRALRGAAAPAAPPKRSSTLLLAAVGAAAAAVVSRVVLVAA